MKDFKNWEKFLCKELEEHMDCLQEKKELEDLCVVEKLAKTIVKLQEMETYCLMIKCLEDEFGYDRETGDFEDKDSSSEWMLYAVKNAYTPSRMTTNPPYYPTMNRGGQRIGREYGHGEYMNGGRYGERSTDRSMMYPYGEYERGMMNTYDGRSDRSGMDGRSDGRSGDYRNDWHESDYMNAVRGGRRRDSRGRYMNMADIEKAKKTKPLTEKEIDEWMKDLISENGVEGPMWDVDQTNALAKKIGVTFKDYTQKEFNAVVNMLYSDMSAALDANGQPAKAETYARMAKSWLEDIDGLDGSRRLAVYYHEIVEPEEDDT